MKFLKLFHEAQFHGAKRLLGTRDRLLWWVIMAILLWCCSTVLLIMISRYIDNPTYTGRFYRFHHHMRFPMVTICPQIRISEQKINRFMDICLMPPGLNKTHVKSIMTELSAFYAPDVRTKEPDDLEILEKYLKYNNLDVESAGLFLTTTCEETILRCALQNEMMDCTKLFHMEFTRYGYCCVFNGKSMRREQSRWVPEAPFTTQEAGPFNGLTLVLNQSHHMDDIDLTYKWLVVQDEQYFADTLFNGTEISRGWETWAGYSRTGMQMSEETRSLDPTLRKCRLASEPLTYFPIYNRIHCLYECEMQQVIKRCGCLAVTYPIVPKVPACTAKDLECVKAARIPADSSFCTCPDACEQDIGEVSIVSFELSNALYCTDQIYNNIDFNKTSVVRVFAAEHSKVIRERKSIYGLYDLYSQLGGLFNAFFGCSFLTMFELLQLIRYGMQCIFKASFWSQHKRSSEKVTNNKKNFAGLETIPEKTEKRYRNKKKAKLNFVSRISE